jgi:hypothetical protein
MYRIKLAAVAVLFVTCLLIPASPAAAAGPIHLVMHVQPSTRVDAYTWVCGREPDKCPALDGYKAHLSSRQSGPNGLAEEWMAYGNVVVLDGVVRQYAGGLAHTFVYEPKAVVAALKYPMPEAGPTVDIWPEDPQAGSYVAGPFVVLLKSDIPALFDRISQRVAAGEEETEDMWKAEIAALAAQIKPGW